MLESLIFYCYLGLKLSSVFISDKKQWLFDPGNWLGQPWCFLNCSLVNDDKSLGSSVLHLDFSLEKEVAQRWYCLQVLNYHNLLSRAILGNCNISFWYSWPLGTLLLKVNWETKPVFTHFVHNVPFENKTFTLWTFCTQKSSLTKYVTLFNSLIIF